MWSQQRNQVTVLGLIRELKGINKMYQVRSWLHILGLALLMSSALVHGAEGAKRDAAKSTAQSPNKRVCKKIKVTGSHVPQRICMKKREWDDMEKAARETLRDTTVFDRGGVSQ